MRVQPRGGKEGPGVRPGQLDGAPRAGSARARDDQLRDTGRPGPFDHGGAVAVITVVREIDPDVDQRRHPERSGEALRACAIVRH